MNTLNQILFFIGANFKGGLVMKTKRDDYVFMLFKGGLSGDPNVLIDELMKRDKEIEELKLELKRTKGGSLTLGEVLSLISELGGLDND